MSHCAAKSNKSEEAEIELEEVMMCRRMCVTAESTILIKNKTKGKKIVFYMLFLCCLKRFCKELQLRLLFVMNIMFHCVFCCLCVFFVVFFKVVWILLCQSEVAAYALLMPGVSC